MEVLIALAPYIVGLVGAVTGIGGLVVSNRKSKADEKAGVSEQETTQRRDTVADRDSLIDRLETRLTSVEARLTAAEDGNVAKALIIRAQGDHIDLLEAHIWAGKAPPPPPRPDYSNI